MFSQAEINTWLAGGMNAYLHWFPAQVRISQLAETLAGMANTHGGIVLFGISPRGMKVHGVQDVSQTCDMVFQAALMLDPPLVLPIPRAVDYLGQKLVSVQVPQGLPNVYSLGGRYWGRQGSQTSLIPAKRLRSLLLERGEIQFERRIPPGVDLQDLDSDRIQEYIQSLVFSGLSLEGSLPNDPDAVNEFLLQRGCVQRVDGKLLPTYAGLLMFSSMPQQWLPSSLILAARFSGPQFSDEFVKQEIRGPLPEQLHQAEGFLRSNLRTIVRMSGLSHVESMEYPYEAVRELLVNAAAHRDYNAQGDTIHIHLFSNRLEIHSPGGLPGPVNLSNLLEARFARNAVITQLLADLGFVERLGYGLDRVVSAMSEMRLPPPKFEEIAGSFRVTLYNNLVQPKDPGPVYDLLLSQDLI
jgi:ATP-dependent DNA helicase RecG